MLIASALNGGYVTWPGEFDAWIRDSTNMMVVEHRTNGTYRMEMESCRPGPRRVGRRTGVGPRWARGRDRRD